MNTDISGVRYKSNLLMRLGGTVHYMNKTYRIGEPFSIVLRKFYPDIVSHEKVEHSTQGEKYLLHDYNEDAISNYIMKKNYTLILTWT